MTNVKADALTDSAAKIFNAMARGHNRAIQKLEGEGVTPTQALVASYIAARIILARFEKEALALIQEESRKNVEVIIAVLSEADKPVADA